MCCSMYLLKKCAIWINKAKSICKRSVLFKSNILLSINCVFYVSHLSCLVLDLWVYVLLAWGLRSIHCSQHYCVLTWFTSLHLLDSWTLHRCVLWLALSMIKLNISLTSTFWVLLKGYPDNGKITLFNVKMSLRERRMICSIIYNSFQVV